MEFEKLNIFIKFCSNQVDYELFEKMMRNIYVICWPPQVIEDENKFISECPNCDPIVFLRIVVWAFEIYL